MKRTSPPVGVQARPVATPGILGAAALLGEDAAAAEQLAGPLGRDLAPCPSTLPSATSRATLRQTVPIWRSRLRTPASRVYSSMIAVRAGVGELDLRGLQPVGLDLARDQVAAGDVLLLVERVAGELDRLHPVLQRAGDRVEDVGGGDEQRPRRGRTRGRGSGRGRSRSGPGRAPRASPRRGRRGSRRPSCRSRRS